MRDGIIRRPAVKLATVYTYVLYFNTIVIYAPLQLTGNTLVRKYRDIFN